MHLLLPPPPFFLRKYCLGNKSKFIKNYLQFSLHKVVKPSKQPLGPGCLLPSLLNFVWPAPSCSITFSRTQVTLMTTARPSSVGVLLPICTHTQTQFSSYANIVSAACSSPTSSKKNCPRMECMSGA